MLCDAVAIQSSAEPLRSLAYLSLSVHRPCFTSPTPASPLRFCARLHASPSRFDSSQCHCQTMLCRSVPRPCDSVRGDSLLCHSFAIPSPTVLCLASAAHCVTPLSHCVAEIRIAPQSLCCSSGSKTELSLPYAVLDCAALHLSVATPCATSLFLCCAPPGTAYPRRCFARRAY